MKRLILFTFCVVFAFGNLSAGKEIEVSREFTLFTSQQASGYLKPLFTTIGESFNSGLYTNANYKAAWSVALDLTLTGMIIPNSQKSYSAELPDLYGSTQYVLTARKSNGLTFENESGFINQPTLYGGPSTAVFAAPQNHFQPDSFYKSIAFVEGNQINLMSGMPSLQLIFGLPTRTQIRLRYFGLPVQGSSLSYFTFAVNQNIDKPLALWDDSTMSLAANFAYHSLSRSPGLDLSSFSAGLHYSKAWGSLSATFGVQYEDLSGTLIAVRSLDNNTDLVNNPYPEIRNSEDLNVDIQSFTNFRLGGGLSWRYGILELYGSAYYASQPVLSAGLAMWIFEQDVKIPEPEPEPIPIPEPEPVPVPILITEMDVPKSPEVPDLKVDIPEPVVAMLSAEVNAFSVENGVEKPLVTINMEQKISRHVSPLLPMLFFDEASSEIPSKYSKISADSAKRFVGDEVSEGSALDVYYEIMNIIGRRLLVHKDAKITLTGTNTGVGKEKNNSKLSQERADNVKNYLTDVWGIDPNRISVKARNLPAKASNSKDPDGIQENRRVEISSDTWEIVAPSVIQDTARMVLPAIIRFKQSAVAEAGLADWKLYVASNTQKVKEESGKGEIKGVIDWKVQENELIKRLIKNNLQFNLSVSDIEGKTYLSDVHTLPVTMKTIQRDNAVSGDTITNLYDLILFDYNKSTLSSDNQRIIDMIKSELPENAIVKVTGFTDRMGKEDYNQNLSLSRAKSSAKALGKPDAETIGSGETRLLYNNDLPEGRFYSRTVIVEVKIPIK